MLQLIIYDLIDFLLNHVQTFSARLITGDILSLDNINELISPNGFVTNLQTFYFLSDAFQN